MTETSEAAACAGIVEDIAALARKFAEKEPYRSASGPEALLALANHLDDMVARDRAGQSRVIRVAVRKKRSVWPALAVHCPTMRCCCLQLLDARILAGQSERAYAFVPVVFVHSWRTWTIDCLTGFRRAIHVRRKPLVKGTFF
jgi:hypothetical protein